ncbi:MAG: ABC transporter ATP-binding protein [Ignavibacteria bacterium]|nr:ABC transporter ATP-binding protein [Ignavibacteria bacterium]
MADAISLERLSFRYPGSSKAALDEVSFLVPEGSVCAVLGPSQAGKTTLLYALAGVLGSRFANAKVAGGLSVHDEYFDGVPRSILFPRVSLVLQESRIQITGFRSTVREELAFTLQNLQIAEPESAERIRDAAEALAISRLLDRNPLELSGGELHRVAIATVLVARPQVLLLDEPARSLDSNSVFQLSRALNSLRKSQTTLFTDADLELPLQLADQYIVLNRGKVLFTGNRGEFINSLNDFVGLLPVDDWLEITGHLRRNPAIRQTIDPRIRRFLP